MIKATLSSFND